MLGIIPIAIQTDQYLRGLITEGTYDNTWMIVATWWLIVGIVVLVFKTTKEQKPLSPVVSNQSSTFFFRIYTWDSFHCGSVSIAMEGRLWLPFFYREPGQGPPDSPNWYGDWLPTNIEIETRFPVFVEG